MAPVSSYRVVVILVCGARRRPGGRCSLASLARAEAATRGEKRASRATFAGLSGLDRSRDVVLKLSALFALDSFGGGFVIQSFAAYWFYLRFGVDPATLGAIFFWANILAGISALLASRLASRFGLVKTMVATHLPSNVLLILVPLMPTLPLAVLVLLVRFSISQMDVPTQAVLRHGRGEPRGAIRGGRHHRRGANDRRGDQPAVRRASCSPGPALINLPFFIAGTLKIAYDLLLYREFVAVRPPEEAAATTERSRDEGSVE